jgi:hypothetical protein
VLDRLRGTDDGGIKYFLVCHFARDFVAFLDQTVDYRAFDARALSELLEGFSLGLAANTTGPIGHRSMAMAHAARSATLPTSNARLWCVASMKAPIGA